mgnify:CR=1 FL=1
MALSARDQKEKDDLDKLDDLRKSYLAKKGKKPTPKNIKVDSRSAREKKDAADYKKLEVLRKRYLTNVKKSVRPKAKKINSVKEIDTVIKEIKKPTISIAVVTVEPKKGDGKLASVVKRSPMSKLKKGDGKLASVVKRSSGVFKKKRKIPEGRGINKKVPKSVSKMTLAEKEFYFNINNKDNPSVKRGTKKSSAGTFVTYPQFTLAEYLKMSKRDRYLVGLPETDERLSRNSRNILTFTPIKN